MRRRGYLPIAVFIVLVLVILTTGFITADNLSRMRDEDLAVRGIIRTEVLIGSLFSALQDAETGERGYLLTGNPADLEPYNRAAAGMSLRFVSVGERFEHDADQLTRLHTLHQLADQKMALLKSAVEAKQRALSDGSADPVAEPAIGREVMDQIRAQVSALLNAQTKSRGESLERSRRAFNNARAAGFAASAIALLLSLFTAWVVASERRLRTRDEALLYDEKERFRTTLASIGDGVMVIDTQGRVEFVNPVAQTLTGYGADALGQSLDTVFQVIGEHDRKPIRQPVEQLLKEGSAGRLANPALLLRRDGSEIPIEENATSIRDAKGNPCGVALVFRDATQKRQYTMALQRSEAEYRALFDEAGVGNANVTPGTGIITRANRRLAALTGYGVDELVGLELHTLLADGGRGAVESLLRDLGQDAAPIQAIETTLKRKSGAPIEVRLSANTIQSEVSSAQVLVVVEDISEVNQAIAALRENETRLRLILENVIAFVLLLDRDGRVMQINGEARAIGGRASLQLVGRRLDESFLFSYDPAIARRVRDAIEDARSGKTARADLRTRVGQGVYITIDASIAPVYDNSDQPAFLVASGVDISQRKAVEEALQQSDRRKDEFLAMLGHELRNPLAPIATATALLRTTKGLDPRVFEHSVGVLERQSEHLTSLVNDLLDVARFTSGKIVLRLETIDIRDPLHRAIEISESLFVGRRQKFSVDIAEQPMLVRGDLHRLTQIFGNLLNNASKYSEVGASVMLAARASEGQVMISVSDTGMGISAAILPHVFELFTQSERALDRSQGGLGIGLTLVKRLVELHHGDVRADSAGVGQGSVFSVTLPQVAATTPDQSSDLISSGSATALSILVVDDNLDAAETLCELLRLLGHEVRVAYDGPSALSIAEQQTPDVIMLDIGLPGMSGFEVAARLRHLPETRSSTLIAVTGYGRSSDRERSLEAGFDAHLVKPVDADELTVLLSRRARQSGAVT
jgi:PAS domain S-box-containing protein